MYRVLRKRGTEGKKRMNQIKDVGSKKGKTEATMNRKEWKHYGYERTGIIMRHLKG